MSVRLNRVWIHPEHEHHSQIKTIGFNIEKKKPDLNPFKTYASEIYLRSKISKTRRKIQCTVCLSVKVSRITWLYLHVEVDFGALEAEI